MFDKPEIALTLLVEEGGQRSDVAGLPAVVLKRRRGQLSGIF